MATKSQLKKKRPTGSRPKKRETTARSKRPRLSPPGQPGPVNKWMELRRSGIHGLGAFAVQDIPKGTKIIEYTGERINNAEADRRYEDDKMDEHHTFLFILSSRTCVDAAYDGNEARFINHSCDPNCETGVWNSRIWISSIKRIPAGTELTYDYQYDDDPQYTEKDLVFYACECGSPKCRRTIVMTDKLKKMSALRGLLRGIVDYAGLFPPAALDMMSAVRNYASYRADPAAWMLGRFVLPVARLDEFENAFASVGEGDWRLSALVGADPISDAERVRAFNLRNSGRAVIDSLEGKVATRNDIERMTALAGPFEVFAEIPLDPDPAPLIAAVKHVGLKAKMRTGGVVASAVPSPTSVVRFVRACLDAGVAFKATAGLHHPLRAEYRLTYDDGSPTGTMFGYLNVFLAAAFMAQGMSDADAERVLDERDASAFELDDAEIRWRGHALSASQAREMRERVAVSFGSCSFREPVDELRSMATA